jgi:acetyl esterase
MKASFPERIEAAGVAAFSKALFAMPDGALRAAFGEPPPEAAGLRPDAWAMARLTDLLERDDPHPSPEDLRVETELTSQAVCGPMPRGLEVRESFLGDAGRRQRARLYRPLAAPQTGPLLVFFHGGGWVVGSIDSHDQACATLAHNSGLRVLSVEYRLAPEHRFPAAPDDALFAWQEITANPRRFGADPERIAVGGDSAGGNLAAVLCQDLRAAGLDQPALQVLIYPVTEVGSQRPSTFDYNEGYYLSGERMGIYSDFYLDRDDYDDPRASPLKGEDLSGLAPAYVLTALADPLRDEGEAYAARLREAGVEVRLDRLPLLHAWFNVTLARSSRAAHAVLAEGLSSLLAD